MICKDASQILFSITIQSSCILARKGLFGHDKYSNKKDNVTHAFEIYPIFVKI